MRARTIIALTLTVLTAFSASGAKKEFFPDGTRISEWFYQTSTPDISSLGKIYRITDFGVLRDSTVVQTEAIQAVIDRASSEGGGVVCIPQGTFLSGSLFFKPGTHLYLEKDATLKGSDDISDFQIIDARVEGQNLRYFAALVNAIGVDGFTLSGQGTINGNGERYWRAFWLRLSVIPTATNMDEMRPRLLFISHCDNAHLDGVRLINSPFWTTHIYKCNNIRLTNLYIFAPHAPVAAPSSDSIDVDACENVLIKGCSLSASDDAIALKGGKGPWADTDENNGANINVLIEDCHFGFCHSALTCGSESIHDRNILMRRCDMKDVMKVLYLKCRPDTPQLYEYITVENVTGYSTRSFLEVGGWMQFFDLKGRPDKPMSYGRNITFRNIDMECVTAFEGAPSENYELSDFSFENVRLKVSKDPIIDKGIISNLTMKRVAVTQ